MARLPVSGNLSGNEMINLLNEDNEDLVENDDFIMNIAKIQQVIKEEITKRNQAVRIKKYFEEVVPDYPNSKFRLHFRMTHTGVERLSNILQDSPQL